MHGVLRIAAFFCLFAPLSLQAEIYKWVDDNGRTHFSDKPPSNQQKRNAAVLNKPAKAKASTPSLQAKSEYRQPAASDALRARKLFENEKFGELNRVLAGRLQAVKKDITSELQLRDAYQTFQQDVPAWEALFDRWIAQYPRQYQGYLARATYLVHRGWEARGGAYIDETPQENIDRMVAFMDRAQSDVSRALRFEDGSLWAYCQRINIAKSGGHYPDALRTLEQANNRYPANYLARKYYIETLDPKWGGSPLSMISFANSAQHNVGTNPRLRRLVSYAYYEAGRMAYINKEYSEATGLLSIAIDKGGRPRSYFVRGKSYAREGEYEKALADFNAAINQNTEDGDYYYWRAKSFAAVKRYDESLIDIQRAYALKPDDKWINKFRLKLMAYTATPEIPTADGAAKGSEAAEVLFRQAKELIESNQPEQARIALERAIEMSPGQFRYYKLVDHALFVQGKTRDILKYWKAYLLIKPNDHRAYLERSGTYYHLQDFDAAKVDAKKAMDLGSKEARRIYQRLQQLTGS